MKVAIIGAGLIGLYVGARLIEAGLDVVFVGRERMQKHIEKYGLKVNSFEQKSYSVPLHKINFFTDYHAIGPVDAYFITVKTTHSSEMLKQLVPHLRPESVVVNLQNGVENKEIFESFGVARNLLEGMVHLM